MRIKNQKHCARSIGHVARIEELERRLCLASAYQVVAKTGDAGLTNIQQSGSINDSGEVAFVGDVAGGEAIFVGGPNDATPRDITPGFLNPFRFFGLGIQINDNNQVAAVDRVSTGNLLTYARYWDAQGTDTHVDIARGSSPNLLTSDFDAISNFVGINNNNQVVFEGLDGSLENLYASSTLVSRLDPAQTALSAPQVSRPLIADDGSFVLQYKAGTTQQIEVFRQKTATGIASTGSSNWTQLGFSPGITDDGKVVAFYGSDTNGPGIFIYAYGAIERIAGVSGNGHKDPGERLVNGTDVGPFSSFSVNTRVSVKVQADGTLQVVFLATGTDKKLGLYDISLRIGLVPPTTYSVVADKLIVEVGDTISGLAGAITGLSIYDPLNTNGQIAFWASTSSSQAVIRYDYDPALYDFSGTATIAPVNLIYHDQFDAPTAGMSSSLVPGGSACGAASLDMALQELGLPDLGVLTTFNSLTMNTDNNFTMKGAQYWMQTPSFRSLYGANVYSTVNEGDTWSTIDSKLAAGRPVILSTKLSVKASNNIHGPYSNGHDILLLGIGQDPSTKAAIQRAYPNDSGNYYIVADPAGNYFADPTSGGICGVNSAVGHYGISSFLRNRGIGENYAGDFAVYPTEQLVHFARTNGKGGLQTLTLESGADLTVGVHSPVNILVTDPLGRQTGYLADGTFVQQIPGSSYDVEVDDSDEDPYVPPTDPVSDVTIPNPMPGSYEIQLTGTATGPYTLDSIAVSAQDTVLASSSHAGTTTPGATVEYNLTIPVTPVANDDTATVVENTANNPIDVLTNDADVTGTIDPTTVVITNQPTNGSVSVDPATGLILYTPHTNYLGADSFMYTVKDSQGQLSNAATVSVTVSQAGVHAAPIAIDDGYSTSENQMLTVGAPGVIFNDFSSGGNLTATDLTLPSHGTLTFNPDGSFTYVPAMDYSGSDSFTYDDSDGTNTSNPATVNLVVIPPYAPPVANNDNYTAPVNSELTVGAPGVLFNDLTSGGTLTATEVTSPSHGTLILNADGSFSYVPVTGYNGPDSFTYDASDGTTTSGVATVALGVGTSTLSWDGTTNGNWTDAHWSGSASLTYPNSTVDAIIGTASVVNVTSSQMASSLGISNGGQIAVGPTGVLSVINGASVTGGGTLTVDPNGVFSAGGTLFVDSGSNVTGGSVTANAFQLNDGTASANLSGPGGLTKDTGGTVILSGTNSYLGNTLIDGGTLIATNGGAIPTGTNVTVGAGAALTADGLMLGALVIGGTASAPATVTLASTDASGNPLAASGVAPTSEKAAAMAFASSCKQASAPYSSANLLAEDSERVASDVGAEVEPLATSPVTGIGLRPAVTAIGGEPLSGNRSFAMIDRRTDAAGSLASTFDGAGIALASPLSGSLLASDEMAFAPPAPSAQATSGIGPMAKDKLALLDAAFASDLLTGSDDRRSEWIGADTQTLVDDPPAVALADNDFESLAADFGRQH